MSDTHDNESSEGVLPALIAGLATEVRNLNRILARELGRRPTKGEVTFRRRLTTFYFVFVLLGAIMVVDQHAEACGPGHRAEVIIEDLSEGEIQTQDDFVESAERGEPGDICGLTFPLHTHNGHPWPERQHIEGILMYATLFMGLGLWVYAAKRDERMENFTNTTAHNLEEEEN